MASVPWDPEEPRPALGADCGECQTQVLVHYGRAFPLAAGGRASAGSYSQQGQELYDGGGLRQLPTLPAPEASVSCPNLMTS